MPFLSLCIFDKMIVYFWILLSSSFCK